MDGKTVSNEEKYFEIFERLKNVGFRKEIQAGCKIVSLEILWLLECDKFRESRNRDTRGQIGFEFGFLMTLTSGYYVIF